MERALKELDIPHLVDSAENVIVFNPSTMYGEDVSIDRIMDQVIAQVPEILGTEIEGTKYSL